MKKVIFIAASLLALAACNKEVNVTSEKGYLNFNLAADDVIVTTKAAVTDLSSYTVYVGETDYNYGTQINGQTLTLNPGKYAVYAENMTPDEAHSENGGNGALRIASQPQEITVAAGQTASATLNCVAANAKISVTFDKSFQNAFSTWDFTIGYTDKSRTLALKTQNSAEYFYNIMSGTNLKLTLSAVTKVDSQTKTSVKDDFTIQAGYHYTVNYSAGTSGYVNITVTADDELKNGGTTDVTVYPYSTEG